MFISESFCLQQLHKTFFDNWRCQVAIADRSRHTLRSLLQYTEWRISRAGGEGAVRL